MVCLDPFSVVTHNCEVIGPLTRSNSFPHVKTGPSFSVILVGNVLGRARPCLTRFIFSILNIFVLLPPSFAVHRRFHSRCCCCHPGSSHSFVAFDFSTFIPRCRFATQSQSWSGRKLRRRDGNTRSRHNTREGGRTRGRSGRGTGTP